MADIELVIKISEDVYTRLFDNGVPTSLADGIVIDTAIRKGKVLPKGHGRLIDESQIAGDSSWDIADRLDATPTIIEADTEYEVWNGYHGQITAPKGTFEKIWNDCKGEEE